MSYGYTYIRWLDKQHGMDPKVPFLDVITMLFRSSAIGLLQLISKEGGTNIMRRLMHSLEELEPDYQVLAANLLLQLDTLVSSYIIVA